jgi:hypothetical protein
MPRPKGIIIGYWIFTALFCLQIGFTAYAQLYLPPVAHAHFSVGDGPEAWGFAAATGVLWGLSYFFWRHLQVTTLEGVPHGGVYPEPLLNATRTG